MEVTENGNTFNCSCGFSWQRGTNGTHNCEPGLYRQITALQQKLDAVVAESVTLKGFVEERCWVYDDDVGRYRDAHNYLPETPATDAILNGLRADGVQQLSAFAGQEYQRFAGDRAMQRKWKGIVLLCSDFAYKLRAGNADKAGE
ncbi:hypothetical protein [Pantoea sp.]|uniref:hypothetical protein n=1 Tax=Pantoea sp. TaxID=69393 RepID=UPI0028AD41D7|nr:hypothetical protein [Pantoea sp.]